jgi:Rieske Fe-S protein
MTRIKRRDFVAGMAIAGTGACLAGINGCIDLPGSPKTPEVQPGAYLIENGKLNIALAQEPELMNIGGAMKISDPKLPEPVIIARTGNNQFAVMSLKCTHAGNEVQYVSAQQQFRCSKCDHSLFDLNGNPVQGPAKKPLTKYPSRLGLLDRNKLIIYLT